MSEHSFMKVADVAKELDISQSYAYKIIRRLNAELKELGLVTVAGRVNRKYFYERLYMVYYIGSQHGQEQQNIEYAEGYIAAVAPMFSKKLDRLFETMEAEESLTYKAISDLIILYFDIMGIQVVEYESGFAIGIKEKRPQKNQ